MIKKNQSSLSSPVNYWPPEYARCSSCDGRGWWMGMGKKVHPCNYCCSTGRAPIPLPEVIRGLRRR